MTVNQLLSPDVANTFLSKREFEVSSARKWLGRRDAFLTACGSLVCLLVSPSAYAATGIRQLDTAAVVVKAPDKVVLIAIANAGSRLVAVGEHGVIVYSDDNGRSWRQGAVPVNVTLTAVAFANASVGWAVGHYGVILRTTDGGRNWQMQLDGIQANQLTLVAAKEAVADNDPSPGTPLAEKRANLFVAAGPDKPFLSLLVSSPETATVFGAYRMVMRTTDGGKTWVDWSLHIGDPLSHNLYAVTTVSSDIYVVGEAGRVFRSTDGGDHFPEVTAPTDATLFSAVPAGDGGVFVCGVAGQAFRSDDTGKTWQAVNLLTQSNLTGVRLLRSGAILAIGEGGGLFTSFDHARTFVRLPQALPMAPYDLAEAQNGDVAVVGSRGVITIRADVLRQSQSGG